jgi:hypothetical protein
MEKTSGVRVSQSAVKKPDKKGGRRLSHLLLVVLLSAGYLLPTAIALHRNRMTRFDTTLLFILNLSGGWTIIGWFVALYIALRSSDDVQAQTNLAPTAAVVRVRKVVLPSLRAYRGASLGVRPRAYSATGPSAEDLPPALRLLMGERPALRTVAYGEDGVRYAPNRYALLSSTQRMLAERKLYSPAARWRRQVQAENTWLRQNREDGVAMQDSTPAAGMKGRSSWAQRIAEEEAEYAQSSSARVNRYQATRRFNSVPASRTPTRPQGGLSRIERFAML